MSVLAFLQPGLKVGQGAGQASPGSSEAASNAPTETETARALGSRDVTAVIVDRPYVPADLVERYWYARDMQPSQAGQLGSTARITMAPGELPIAASDGLVGAATNGELFSRDRQSVLRVFDVRSGVSIMELPTTLYLEHGAFAGGYLFWSGTDIDQSSPGEPEIYPGGGLWAADPASGGKPVLVIPPEPKIVASAIAPWGQGGRAPLAISVTGRTVASPVYLEQGAVGRTDVVDVGRLEVRTRLSGYVCAVTDTTAIMCEGDGALVGVDLNTSGVLWKTSLGSGTTSGSSPVFVAAVVAYEAIGVVEFSRDNELIIASFDLATGSLRDLLVQGGGTLVEPPLFLAPSLSSERHLVLLPEIGVGPTLELAKGKVFAAVLDTVSSTLSPSVFAIGAP